MLHTYPKCSNTAQILSLFKFKVTKPSGWQKHYTGDFTICANSDIPAITVFHSNSYIGHLSSSKLLFFRLQN